MADERVRVAHVITRMIVGGAQETVLLASSLADRDRFEPLIVCGPQTGSEGSLHAEARRRGVELVVVPELVREVNPLKDARVVPVMTRLLRERRIDVVHTNSSKAGIVGRLAARRAGLPALHTVHGWPFHDGQPALPSLVWRRLERATAPLANWLVVVAETDRAKGLAAGIGREQQYVTVRSGLELQLYSRDAAVRAEVRTELGIPTDATLIGGIGRLSPQKDPLALVEASLSVLHGRPGAHLLLVGDGPLRAEVERIVAGSEVHDRVVMTGLRDDVPRLLNALDVFVLSSRWEGLPRAVIQAMATQVPVVATDADGVRDVVQDGVTGLLVARGDRTSLGHALMRLVDDPVDARRLADAAHARIAEFDAGVMVAQLENLYAELASRRVG